MARTGGLVAPLAPGAAADVVARGAFGTRHSLAVISISGWRLSLIPTEDVEHNIAQHIESYDGGQARVYCCSWQNVAARQDGSQPAIPDGKLVAIKAMSLPGHLLTPFEDMTAKHQFLSAGVYLERQLRIEVNILGALHEMYYRGYCGTRVVRPLGVVRREGQWYEDAEKRRQPGWEPMYGFCLPYYKLGSLVTLMRTVCNNRADPGVVSRLLSYRNISGELLTLARELRKIHTVPCGGKGLQLQDLTANNLLCEDDPKGGGVRLLFSDPALALPPHLIEDAPQANCTGTWLWGSSKACNKQFDPQADLYGLCFCFADLWMVAEGALILPSDTTQLLEVAENREFAVQFMRTMMVECLKVEHNGSRLVRRVQRHTPVAWLGAWAILLGFRDYKDIKHWREDRLPCLRPTEEQMLPVFERWARVVALAEDVPLELAAEQARSPACSELVTAMTELLASLVSLSHLDDAGPQQDPNLAWLAANFMAQDHPLVTAMREQGAAGVGTPSPKGCLYDGEAGWADAIQLARLAMAPPKRVWAAAPVPSGRKKEGSSRKHDARTRALAEIAQWHDKQGISLPDHLRRACLDAAAELGLPISPMAPMPTAAAVAAAAPTPAPAAAPIPAPAPAAEPATMPPQPAAAEPPSAATALRRAWANLAGSHRIEAGWNSERWNTLLGDSEGAKLVAQLQLGMQHLAALLHQPGSPAEAAAQDATAQALQLPTAAAALPLHPFSAAAAGLASAGAADLAPGHFDPWSTRAGQSYAAAAGQAPDPTSAQLAQDDRELLPSPAKRRLTTTGRIVSGGSCPQTAGRTGGTYHTSAPGTAACSLPPALPPVHQFQRLSIQPAVACPLSHQPAVHSAPVYATVDFSLPQPAWQVPAAVAPTAATGTLLGSLAPTALTAAVGAQPAAAPAVGAGSGWAGPAYASAHEGGAASSAYGTFPTAPAGSHLGADGAASPGPGGGAAFSAPFSAHGGSFGIAQAAAVFVGGGADGSPAQPAGAAAGHPRTQALPPPASVPAGGSKGDHAQDVNDVACRLAELTDPSSTERPPVFAGIDTAEKQLAFLIWLSTPAEVTQKQRKLLLSTGLLMDNRSRGQYCGAVVGTAEYNTLTGYYKSRKCALVRSAAGQLAARLDPGGGP